METDVNKPDGIALLAAALVAAQSELSNPPKSRTAKGTKFSYTYADLSDVIDVVRPVLSKHGLAIVHLMQLRQGESEGNILVARLIHASGQYLDSVYPVPSGLAAQELGSWMTYMRRYSTCNLVFVAGETDEDGAAATAGQKSAEELADEIKRKEAHERLEQAKSVGRIRSAYSGEPIKPGETLVDGKIVKESSQQAAPIRETTTAGEAGGHSTEQGAGKRIDPRLVKLMAQAHIGAAELKEAYVAMGHKTATMAVEDLPPEYIEVLIKPQNWTKVVARIKGGK